MIVAQRCFDRDDQRNASRVGYFLGIVAKTAKAAGIEHVGLGNWLEVDPAKIGKTDGLTLAEAVRAFNQRRAKRSP